MTNEEAKKELEKALDNNTIYDVEESYKYIIAMHMAIEALEQQPCEDCISREKVIRLVEQYPNIIGNRYSGLIADIKHLPSVQPQPKRGKWISIDATHSKCEKCEAIFQITSPNAEVNFCPSCGVLLESEMQI